MKFLMLIKHSESYRGEPIPQALMDAMGEFVTEGFKSGILKDTAGLKATAEGFRVRSSGNQLKVTDGPFTESKELVAGFWMLQCKSLDEAIEWVKRSPLDGGARFDAGYMSSSGRTSHSPSNAGQWTRCSSMNCRATLSASSFEATSTIA